MSNFDWFTDPANQGHSSGSIIFNSCIHFLNLKQKNHVKNQNGKTIILIVL